MDDDDYDYYNNALCVAREASGKKVPLPLLLLLFPSSFCLRSIHPSVRPACHGKLHGKSHSTRELARAINPSICQNNVSKAMQPTLISVPVSRQPGSIACALFHNPLCRSVSMLCNAAAAAAVVMSTQNGESSRLSTHNYSTFSDFKWRTN